ncbi:BsuPI-related putative proteinase inhibitor [Evansella tamaricis]|uniref:Intracellular proteinase inhibitor BsuPI domain-containing protein n=1 Tax=Evansella tamaricis TaxID=2069301 RepID=A0ABS6JJS4_9BACI|nr:BsuPI-related putative proteinase inhibitor [Evansella tamaricis]MBU9713920.1 hypothetical protein [Evansella tamaricis]
MRKLIVLVLGIIVLLSGCTGNESSAGIIDLTAELKQLDPVQEGEYRFLYNVRNTSDENILLKFETEQQVSYILTEETGEVVSLSQDLTKKDQEDLLEPEDNIFHEMVFLGLEEGSYTLEAWLTASDLEEYKQKITFLVE